MANIPDPNLRLTLLNSAWEEGLLPRFDKEAFYRDVLKEPYDPAADYNYEIDNRVRDHLLSIPLTDDVLAKLKIVTWDGGNEVHHDIWTQWDGESDEFDVRDLRGIEACRGLEFIQFLAGTKFRDCSPLSGLPNLSEVMLLGGRIADLSPLLTLPKVSKVEVAADDADTNRAVIGELRSRGVDVTVY